MPTTIDSLTIGELTIGDANQPANREGEAQGGRRRRPRTPDHDPGGETANNREGGLRWIGRIPGRIIRRTRQAINRMSAKEIAVLLGTVATLGLGVTLGTRGVTKLHGYLTSTKWEDRDTGIDKDGNGDTNPECLSILERTRGQTLLILNCATMRKETCELPGKKPVDLHNGVFRLSFENYKPIEMPDLSSCEGGYKETILKPK